LEIARLLAGIPDEFHGEADRGRRARDIEALARRAGFASSAEALMLVEAFYPLARISPKARFGVAEIMEKIFPPST
jgi:hypothetical protein